MEKRKVFDRRVVKLEKIMNPNYIPYLGGRPNRVTVISNEDVSNLRIALNTTVSMEDFLARV